MNLLSWIAAGTWFCFFLQTLVNRSLTVDLSKGKAEEREDWPLLSIVVPARNEEKGIEAAVRSFCEQSYPGLEVIVVDDGSTDGTPAILARLASEYPNLKILPGTEPPEGWLGKPNTLERGRLAAKGAWLLFVDADVVYSPDLLKRAMAYVLREGGDMLFLGPNFSVRGVLEAALMAQLYVLSNAVLPMFLATRSRSKHMAAGGGVFNLVKREALEACGVFTSLKDAVADDVALGFAIKGAGFKLSGALAGPLIRIRIYEGGLATIRGFTKNIYPILRRLPWTLPLPFLLGGFLSFFPYFALFAGLRSAAFPWPAVLALSFMHLTCGALAWIFRQPWHIAFTTPLREAGWWWIILRSALAYHREGILWRGRKYNGI